MTAVVAIFRVSGLGSDVFYWNLFLLECVLLTQMCGLDTQMCSRHTHRYASNDAAPGVTNVTAGHDGYLSATPGINFSKSSVQCLYLENILGH